MGVVPGPYKVHQLGRHVRRGTNNSCLLPNWPATGAHQPRGARVNSRNAAFFEMLVVLTQPSAALADRGRAGGPALSSLMPHEAAGRRLAWLAPRGLCASTRFSWYRRRTDSRNDASQQNFFRFALSRTAADACSGS